MARLKGSLGIGICRPLPHKTKKPRNRGSARGFLGRVGCAVSLIGKKASQDIDVVLVLGFGADQKRQGVLSHVLLHRSTETPSRAACRLSAIRSFGSEIVSVTLMDLAKSSGLSFRSS
jgi:hypothetical protein